MKFSPVVAGAFLVQLVSSGVYADVSNDLLARVKKVIDSLSPKECKDFAQELVDDYGPNLTDDEACDGIKEADYKKDFLDPATKCTEADYDKFKDAVCGASAITISIMTTVVCLIANVFRNMLSQ